MQIFRPMCAYAPLSPSGATRYLMARNVKLACDLKGYRDGNRTPCRGA
jgi:hypothetical protein